MDSFRSHGDEIGHRIGVLGIALGIDWDNEAEVRSLAQEALDHHPLTVSSVGSHSGHIALLKVELFGLAALMLKTMKESADRGFLTHGDSRWKTFAKALWLEHDRREMKAS